MMIRLGCGVTLGLSCMSVVIDSLYFFVFSSSVIIVPCSLISLSTGSFAVWGGAFSMFDCTFQYLRNKDDHWNAIASGASTGGLLALRGGWRSASKQAVIGGVLLAIIEGVMVIFSRRATSTPRDQYYQAVEMERKMQAVRVLERQQQHKHVLDAETCCVSATMLLLLVITVISE